MQATLLHSALPFMLNLPPTRVADKLRELLGEAQARPVLDKLMKSTGSSEMIAQRVCLEVRLCGWDQTFEESLLKTTHNRAYAQFSQFQRKGLVQNVLARAFA